MAAHLTRDPDLVGHWRHTTSTYTGEFGMATDTHVVLQGDGRFVRYSRTESSFSSSYSPEEYGTWHTRDGVLHLEFDGGLSGTYEYTTYPDEVLLHDGPQRLWDRIG